MGFWCSYRNLFVVNFEIHPFFRIHSSPTIGLSWLLRHLDKLRAEYSNITINLSCSYENLLNECTSKIQRFTEWIDRELRLSTYHH